MTGSAAPVRGRVVIEVRVNTDMVPGWGYDAQDYVDLIQRSLDEQIPHYEPVVTLRGKDETDG